jgi:hypothetical protein
MNQGKLPFKATTGMGLYQARAGTKILAYQMQEKWRRTVAVIPVSAIYPSSSCSLTLLPVFPFSSLSLPQVLSDFSPLPWPQHLYLQSPFLSQNNYLKKDKKLQMKFIYLMCVQQQRK